MISRFLSLYSLVVSVCLFTLLLALGWQALSTNEVTQPVYAECTPDPAYRLIYDDDFDCEAIERGFEDGPDALKTIVDPEVLEYAQSRTDADIGSTAIYFWDNSASAATNSALLDSADDRFGTWEEGACERQVLGYTGRVMTSQPGISSFGRDLNVVEWTFGISEAQFLFLCLHELGHLLREDNEHHMTISDQSAGTAVFPGCEGPGCNDSCSMRQGLHTHKYYCDDGDSCCGHDCGVNTCCMERINAQW